MKYLEEKIKLGAPQKSVQTVNQRSDERRLTYNDNIIMIEDM